MLDYDKCSIWFCEWANEEYILQCLLSSYVLFNFSILHGLLILFINKFLKENLTVFMGCFIFEWHCVLSLLEDIKIKEIWSIQKISLSSLEEIRVYLREEKCTGEHRRRRYWILSSFLCFYFQEDTKHLNC